MRTPEAEASVDAALVSALLRDQHPDLAHHHVGARVDGWDNATFRLGDGLAVRLPRREVGARISATELEWLPVLARHWTFPAPVPLRIGDPGRGYPWRWSVVPWIDGELAYDEPLGDSGARDLGVAIAQIQRADATGAPVNPYRSGTLPEVAEVFDARVRALEINGSLDAVEADALRRTFEAGAGVPEPARVWAHLDLHGANVLTRGGRLAGILDWGDCGGADPATDLGQAMALVGATHAEALLEAYGTAEGPMRVGAGSEGRQRVLARAAAYAVTLASIDADPYRTAGLAAARELAGAA